jgi:hypothetical protein
MSPLCNGLDEWSSSLTQTADQIHGLTRQLERNWNGPLADPVKLLRRLHALEQSVQQLQAESLALSQRRPAVVMRAFEQAQANEKLMQEVSGL